MRPSAAPELAAALPLARDPDLRAVILVEGLSDQEAVRALARRRSLDLAGSGVRVVAMGGATSVARFIDLFGPRGAGVRLTGFCDLGELEYFRRGLERAGFERLTRARLAAMGFAVCVEDLEDELIRALGVEAVEAVVEAAEETGALRTFQQQPAQRGRPAHQQLRRFMGTRSGRKVEYARLLVDHLDLGRVPEPLDHVLDAAVP